MHIETFKRTVFNNCTYPLKFIGENMDFLSVGGGCRLLDNVADYLLRLSNSRNPQWLREMKRSISALFGTASEALQNAWRDSRELS